MLIKNTEDTRWEARAAEEAAYQAWRARKQREAAQEAAAEQQRREAAREVRREAAREAALLAQYERFTRPLSPQEAATYGFVARRVQENNARYRPIAPAERLFTAGTGRVSPGVQYSLDRLRFLARAEEIGDYMPSAVLAAAEDLPARAAFTNDEDHKRACRAAIVQAVRARDESSIAEARCAGVQPCL